MRVAWCPRWTIIVVYVNPTPIYIGGPRGAENSLCPRYLPLFPARRKHLSCLRCVFAELQPCQGCGPILLAFSHARMRAALHEAPVIRTSWNACGQERAWRSLFYPPRGAGSNSPGLPHFLERPLVETNSASFRTSWNAEVGRSSALPGTLPAQGVIGSTENWVRRQSRCLRANGDGPRFVPPDTRIYRETR